MSESDTPLGRLRESRFFTRQVVGELTIDERSQYRRQCKAFHAILESGSEFVSNEDIGRLLRRECLAFTVLT